MPLKKLEGIIDGARPQDLHASSVASHFFLVRRFDVLHGRDHGFDDVLVAGASAKIPGQRFTNGRRVTAAPLPNIGPSAHDHARCTDTALRATFSEKKRLQPVERGGRSERFDGLDAGSLCLINRDETGVHELAVEEHRAGAALALAAPFFRSSEC